MGWFKRIHIVLVMMGFLVNLSCDPIHELKGEAGTKEDIASFDCNHQDDHHNQPESNGHCRLHCHVQHSVFWIDRPIAILALSGTESSSSFFLASLIAHLPLNDLLRPPIAFSA